MATTVTAFVNFGPTESVAARCVDHRPFYQKTSFTQYMSVGDNNDNDRGSSMFDDDMSLLNSRLREVQQKEQTLPLVVLDAMLPRQVLELQVNNALLIELVRDCMARERPYIAMLGIARLANTADNRSI